MAKIEYNAEDREMFNLSPLGKAYLEYNDKIGGKPFAYTLGMPVEVYDAAEVKYGGLIGLYAECIRQGKTWEELLGTTGNYEELSENEE